MKKDLSDASRQIGLSDTQTEELLQALRQKQNERKKIYLLKALIYLGALIVLVPMGWLYFLAVQNGNSLFVSLSYCLLFFLSGLYLSKKKELYTAGGILATLSCLMVPLIVYALKETLHLSPISSYEMNRLISCWLKSYYVQSELATLGFTLFILYWIRFPLLLAIVYGTVVLLFTDLLSFFTTTHEAFLSHYSKIASIIGLFLNFLGFSFYQRSQAGFGFWSYFFGMALCWSGLTLWEKTTEWGYFSYFVLFATLLLFSGFFQRKIFLFFGSLGVIFYIGHLAYIYSHSAQSAYVFASIGFVLITLGAFLLKLVRSRHIASIHNEQRAG